MTSIAGTVADPEAKRRQLIDQLKSSSRKQQKVANVRSTSSANQELCTVDATIVHATNIAGGAGNPRMLLTAIVTGTKLGESGDVFNAISSSPPSIVSTVKVENPMGSAAKEKKAMPMKMAFKGSVLALGAVKASTFLKNEGAVQGPADVPPGTKVVLSGIHCGSFGRNDDPLQGGAMNLSFTDIIVKDKCVDQSKAVDRIGMAMDTVFFSKWQCFEALPAFGDLNHIKAQNPQLGSIIETKLKEYKKELADGLRQKVQTFGTTMLEVCVDGKEASHNLFPDGGEAFNGRAAMLDSMTSCVFSDMHANGKNAYVPLLQRAVMPGDGLPQQLMSLLQEGRTYFAPFFVEPRVKQVEVSGALCHIIFSLYIASTEKSCGVEESASGPFIESSGPCVGANRSLLQLGASFGTQLREKAVMACEMIKYAELVVVPRISKVDPGTEQFSFRDLPFSEGFVINMIKTLGVASVLVSEQWVKDNLLKNGMMVEYKVTNTPEDNAKKLSKRDQTTKDLIYAPPPSLSLGVDNYLAMSETTCMMESVIDDCPTGKVLQFRVLYPGAVDDIKLKEEALDCADSPARSPTLGEEAVNKWLGGGDANTKRLKLMDHALVYAVAVDPDTKPFGTTPPVAESPPIADSDED